MPIDRFLPSEGFMARFGDGEIDDINVPSKNNLECPKKIGSLFLKKTDMVRKIHSLLIAIFLFFEKSLKKVSLH
jgi:hypothetical protein